MTDAEVVPLNSFNRFAYLHARKPRADHLGQPLQVLYGRRPVTQVGTQLSIAAISEVAARCVFVCVVVANVPAWVLIGGGRQACTPKLQICCQVQVGWPPGQGWAGETKRLYCFHVLSSLVYSSGRSICLRLDTDRFADDPKPDTREPSLWNAQSLDRLRPRSTPWETTNYLEIPWPVRNETCLLEDK